MPTALRRAGVLLILASLVAGCSGSKFERPRPRNTTDFGGQVFTPEGQWREDVVVVPPYPNEENLEPFAITGPTDNTFYLDKTAMSAGRDGVFRYILVVRSRTGVDNASFEGIRCETREWKAYAYGTADRTWSPSRDPQWQRVVWFRTNAARYELYRNYLCRGGAPETTRAALAEIRRLRILPPGQNP